MAVIVEATPTHVDIVEQNVDDAVWIPGTNYSRRLKAELSADGKYTIRCTFPDTKVLGWMNIDYGKTYDFEVPYEEREGGGAGGLARVTDDCSACCCFFGLPFTAFQLPSPTQPSAHHTIPPR